MWEYTVKLPARWLSRDQAIGFLGVSEEKFKRLDGAGLFRTDGKGSGKRYDAEDIQAVAVLLARLSALLGTEPPAEPE